MYETAHARTHGVEEEYLSLKGAMGNARLSGRAVGHDGRSCSVLSSRKDRVCLLDREKESSVWCRLVLPHGVSNRISEIGIGKVFQSTLSISKYFVSCLCTVD